MCNESRFREVCCHQRGWLVRQEIPNETNTGGFDGPTVGALNAETPKRTFSKKSRKYFGHEIGVFLTDFHHILHARICNHFQWFPNTPMLPRPLKRPKTMIYSWAFFKKRKILFWDLIEHRSYIHTYTYIYHLFLAQGHTQHRLIPVRNGLHSKESTTEWPVGLATM